MVSDLVLLLRLSIPSGEPLYLVPMSMSSVKVKDIYHGHIFQKKKKKGL